jgi:hypothetical protein
VLFEEFQGMILSHPPDLKLSGVVNLETEDVE